MVTACAKTHPRSRVNRVWCVACLCQSFEGIAFWMPNDTCLFGVDIWLESSSIHVVCVKYSECLSVTTEKIEQYHSQSSVHWNEQYQTRIMHVGVIPEMHISDTIYVQNVQKCTGKLFHRDFLFDIDIFYSIAVCKKSMLLILFFN